ncbi:hypothetical protein ACE3LM_22440 [Enterobacter hormaechei subsp. steigerwaltii]
MLNKYFIAYQILKNGQIHISGSTVVADPEGVEPDVFFINAAKEIAKQRAVMPNAVIITAFNRVN